MKADTQAATRAAALKNVLGRAAFQLRFTMLRHQEQEQHPTANAANLFATASPDGRKRRAAVDGALMAIHAATGRKGFLLLYTLGICYALYCAAKPSAPFDEAMTAAKLLPQLPGQRPKWEMEQLGQWDIKPIAPEQWPRPKWPTSETSEQPTPSNAYSPNKK